MQVQMWIALITQVAYIIYLILMMVWIITSYSYWILQIENQRQQRRFEGRESEHCSHGICNQGYVYIRRALCNSSSRRVGPVCGGSETIFLDKSTIRQECSRAFPMISFYGKVTVSGLKYAVDEL